MTGPRTPYGTVGSKFWDDDVGYQLQAAGPHAVILAVFIRANRYANMLGLYLLPQEAIVRTLRVIPRDAILPTFDELARLNVAWYDPESEFVWVVEMAGERLNPSAPRQTIAAGDKRWLAAMRIYEELPANPFLGVFHEHYKTRLRMLSPRPGTKASPLVRGFTRGIVSPLPSPLVVTVDQLNSDQRTVDQSNRRVEIVETPDLHVASAPTEHSSHNSHTPQEPAGADALAHSDPVEKSEKAQSGELPFGPNGVVRGAVTAAERERMKTGIANVVLNEVMPITGDSLSVDELVEAALERCSKLPDLRECSRALVKDAVNEALQRRTSRSRRRGTSAMSTRRSDDARGV